MNREEIITKSIQRTSELVKELRELLGQDKDGLYVTKSGRKIMKLFKKHGFRYFHFIIFKDLRYLIEVNGIFRGKMHTPPTYAFNVDIKKTNDEIAEDIHKEVVKRLLINHFNL